MEDILTINEDVNWISSSDEGDEDVGQFALSTPLSSQRLSIHEGRHSFTSKQSFRIIESFYISPTNGTKSENPIKHFAVAGNEGLDTGLDTSIFDLPNTTSDSADDDSEHSDFLNNHLSLSPFSTTPSTANFDQLAFPVNEEESYVMLTDTKSELEISTSQLLLQEALWKEESPRSLPTLLSFGCLPPDEDIDHVSSQIEEILRNDASGLFHIDVLSDVELIHFTSSYSDLIFTSAQEDVFQALWVLRYKAAFMAMELNLAPLAMQQHLQRLALVCLLTQLPTERVLILCSTWTTGDEQAPPGAPEYDTIDSIEHARGMETLMEATTAAIYELAMLWSQAQESNRAEFLLTRITDLHLLHPSMGGTGHAYTTEEALYKIGEESRLLLLWHALHLNPSNQASPHTPVLQLSIAQRHFQREDWQAAIEYFLQALQWLEDNVGERGDGDGDGDGDDGDGTGDDGTKTNQERSVEEDVYFERCELHAQTCSSISICCEQLGHGDHGQWFLERAIDLRARIYRRVPGEETVERCDDASDNPNVPTINSSTRIVGVLIEEDQHQQQEQEQLEEREPSSTSPFTAATPRSSVNVAGDAFPDAPPSLLIDSCTIS
jgi:hypothetical protein